MMPCTDSMHPVSETAKQAPNLSEPPTLMTVFTVFFSLKFCFVSFCFFVKQSLCDSPKSSISVGRSPRWVWLVEAFISRLHLKWAYLVCEGQLEWEVLSTPFSQSFAAIFQQLLCPLPVRLVSVQQTQGHESLWRWTCILSTLGYDLLSSGNSLSTFSVVNTVTQKNRMSSVLHLNWLNEWLLIAGTRDSPQVRSRWVTCLRSHYFLQLLKSFQ